MTPLDLAHTAMQSATGDDVGDDGARLRFYQQLADTELFVLLTEEAAGEAISPALFDVEDGQFVLGFDQQERLAEFTGQAVPYAAMTGRVLARMLDGQGIGLGVNLGVAPSSILIPVEAIGWLHRTLQQAPDQVEMRIADLMAPEGGAGVLSDALQAKLATAGGLAQVAWLAGVRYKGGGQGLLLGFVGTDDPVRDALAKAAGEALTFAGIEAGTMDVGFFAASDPVVARLAAVGVRIDLPRPAPRQMRTRAAPGRNPDKPPILK